MNTTITVYNQLRNCVTWFWGKLQLEKQVPVKGRPMKTPVIDILTLGIFKQAQNIATKKSLYEIFDLPGSYKRFVANLNRFARMALIVTALILKSNRREAHLIKHTDSTDIPVCLNKNARHHKTMSVLADWGKNGKGWFYGLKLHITTDLKRNLLAVKFSSGNTHDTTVFLKLNKGLRGVFVADAGYMSEKLQKEFYAQEKSFLFTKTRKNMKKLMTQWQERLYDTRMLIELNFRNLKMFYGLVTSLPRSINGYLAHYTYSILASLIA